MNLSHVNPYGAVPEALKETRLALRDIMADYLATKTQEANLALGQKKAETETAMIQAGIERDRLAGERDLARMAQDAQRFGLQTDLHRAQMEQGGQQFRDRLSEDQRQFDINKKLKEREIGIQGAQLNLSRLQHAPDKIMNIMAREYPNMDPRMRDRVLRTAGFDPNAVTTPQTLQRYQGMLLPVMRTILQSDFKDVMAQAGKTKDPKAKGSLFDQANQIAIQARGIDDFMTRDLSPESAAKIYEKLKSAGELDESVTLADYIQEATTKRKQSQEVVDMLSQAGQARAKHEADPNYDARLTQAINMIKMLDKDPKHVDRIEAGARERANDPAGALEYAEGWADHLLRQHRAQKATPPAAGNETLWPQGLY